jgi:raffinose/stachyose/melibiose transport system permease protein
MERVMKKALLLVIPALAIYVWLVIVPAVNAFHYSLYEWVGFGDKTFTWFSNFVHIFEDEYFILVLKNTLIFVGFGTIGLVSGGLLIALLVDNIGIGHGFFKTIYFLPVVISAVAIGLLWRFIYNPEFGILNAFIRLLGFRSFKHNWLADIRILIFVVLVPVIWQYIGLYMAIFFAGLKAIPETFYEAASIDGASSLQRFVYITLPLLREVAIVCMILSSTGLLRHFDHIWALTKGGPNHISEVLSIYMWNEAFTLYRAGRAMAVAVLMFVISVVITVGIRRLVGIRDFTYSS